MSEPSAAFFFDFVDPLSYLAELELRKWEGATGGRVERVGFELRPPPAPLRTASDPEWSPRFDQARAAASTPLRLPSLVPWTRKAHELHALARVRGADDRVRLALFEAFFTHGRDVGRIDALVEIGASEGLDRTETKAALDVDRHLEEVLADRARAEALGVRELPAVAAGGKVVQGFHNLGDLGTLLGGPREGGR